MQLFRRALMALASLAVTLTGAVAFAAPSSADDSIVFGPAGSIGLHGLPCSSSQVGPTYWEKDDESTQAVLTDYLAINVAPGTTTSRTDTLSHVATVTQQVTNTVGVTASASFSFKLIVSVAASVSTTYNRSVSTTQTTTDTTTHSVTWTFNDPGYYGLYRGVIRSVWTVSNSTCVYQSPGKYVWAGDRYYVTVFTAPEEGTVLCTGAATTRPDWMITDVRTLARKQLGNC